MLRKTSLLVGVAAIAAALTYTISSPASTPVVRADVQTYQGKTAMQWHRVALGRLHEENNLRSKLGDETRALRALRRSFVHQPSSEEALRLAAITYHVSYGFLLALASCESTGGNGLNPNAKNRSSTAAGLGQFLDSTWRSTIYRSESVYSPYANALAMGKEVADGHAGWQWAASRSCWS